MFTFQNGQGEATDRQAGVWSEPFITGDEKEQVTGVTTNQKFRNMNCAYAIGAKHKVGIIK